MLAVFAIGLCLTTATVAWQMQWNARAANTRVDALAARAADAIGQRLRIYEYGLRGARGAAIAAGLEGLDRAHFRQYAESRDFAREFPGARGVAVVRRVRQSDEAAFVAEERQQDDADYAILRIKPHDGDRYLVEFAEPYATNKRLVGFDFASETERRTAADLAKSTGLATLTPPLTPAVKVNFTGPLIHLLLPIYRPGLPIATAQDREQALYGWTATPLVVSEVMNALGHSQDYAVALTDRTDGAPKKLFETEIPQEAADASFVRQIPMTVYGRRWSAEIRPTRAFIAAMALPDPRFVALLGLLLSLLLAGFARLYAQSASRAREVMAEQSRRAAIVESSNDAIVSESLEGIVLDWNGGAEHLFGYTAIEAIGRPLATLLFDESRRTEDEEIRATIAEPGAIRSFDTTRRHKNGSLIEVSVTLSPMIDADGRLIGLSKTLRDITEAKRAQRDALTQNERLEKLVHERTAMHEAARRDLRNILDSVPALIGYWDKDLRNRFANYAYESWFGMGPDAIPGLHISEVLGVNYEPNRPRIEAAMRGESQTFERSVVLPDGVTRRHSLAHYVPDLVDGEVRGFYAVVHDISQQVDDRTRLASALAAVTLVEQKLRASESFLDRAGRIAGVGGWAIDLRTQAMTWSDQTRRMHEVDEDFVPALDNVMAFYPAEARTTIEQAVRDGIAHGRGWDLELPFVTAQGRSLWVRAVGAAEIEDGEPARLVGAFQDITDRRHAAQKLAQTTALLTTVLASASGVSVIATDCALNIQVFNAGAERLLGYSAGELVDVATPVVIHDRAEVEQRARELTEQLGRPVEGGAVFTEPSTFGQPREWTYVRKDGSRVKVSLVVTPMRAESGELTGYLGIAHDITQQKRYEESLRDAMYKAKQASLSKSQFLANMSHEIRTPMNAVIGLSYLLEQTSLDAQQVDFLDKLKRASKSLLLLINDVLDLSKIEAGELAVEHAPFNLKPALQDITDMMSVAADAKKIAFVVDMPDDIPDALTGDVMRLSQILTNLLANAIKFTAEGSVTLEVRPLAVSPTVATLRFSVRDTGIGIPFDLQPRLFTPFAQADVSTTRKFGGTGLGLSIVKRLANLMGGEVGFDSRPGEGSDFWVTIDFSLRKHRDDQAALVAPVAGGEPGLPGIRILVVDDSDINREVARRILELEGAVITLAENGEDAVVKLTAAPQDYDAVLMDVQMPVLDGHAATRVIRSELGLTMLPVIALTAGALTSERERSSANGMNDFVSKPFEPRALVACIRRYLPKDRLTHPEGTDTRKPVSQSERAGPADWPAIAGIDGEDVRHRLGGDKTLFRNMLARMLDEFVVGDAEHSLLDLSNLVTASAHLHKLKGSAGLLGAKEIHRVAGAAEVACRTGDIAMAIHHVSRISTLLRTLQANVAASLPPADEKIDEPSLADGLVDLTAIDELIDLLREQSFSAIALFRTVSPDLRRHFGAERFQNVATCIDELRFDEALAEFDRAASGAPMTHS